MFYSRASQKHNKTKQFGDFFIALMKPSLPVINSSAVNMNPITDDEPLLTEEEARLRLRAKGVNVAEWARERGFSVELTRMVLAGKRKCLRGQSYLIAVALGIKPGPQ